MSYNLYIFAFLIVITCCSLFIAYLAWRRREFPVAVSLFLGMMAGSFYSFGYAFELVSTNLEQIRFWLRVEYIGISFGTLIWFFMILQYTNRQIFFRKWIIVLLAIVPMATIISHYTNEWHFMFYKSMTINESEGFPLVSLIAGPFYKLHVIYSYTLFVIGMGFLIQLYRNAASHMKKQIALMMIGSCGPYGITLVYLSGLLSTPIDFSSFGFLLSGIFYMWGIYQFNMLKLAPMALKRVVESMKDAVIVFDLDNSITSFNQSAKQIIKGLNYKKVIGQSAACILSPYPILLEKMMQEPSMESKVKISIAGDPKYYNVHFSYVYDRSQRLVGKLLLLSDVTEIVLAEETLRSNARQLSELNVFKDKMFNIIAHDIRDPLSTLINLMDILKDDMESDQNSGEVANEMEQQVHKTFTLVENLFDWFQSQKGGMMFNPLVWNLSQAIHTNINLLSVHSDGKQIQILSDIPKEMSVYADKEMLNLIIRNLLSNAIKFTSYGGTIELNADHAGDKIIISIKDTGLGVHPDQVNHLLQEEYPTSIPGTAGEKGIGLGLTLCKEFVQINGGDIWFESVLDQGSVFYFSVPAADESRFVSPALTQESRLSV